MLKVKDNIDLKELEKFGFIQETGFCTKTRTYGLWEGVIKIWVDKNRILHFNSPRLKQIDLVYQMHDLLENDETCDDLRMLSRPALLEENKRLKEELRKIKEKI